MRSAVGFVLGLVVRLWSMSWRRRVVVAEPSEAASPRVLAFWHGRQMALVGARTRPTAVMVSWSKDGRLQAGVMRALGLCVVRGSSSKGGARALYAVIQRLRAGFDAAFAVDGPKGPRGSPKDGAARAALRAKALLVPLGTAAFPSLRLGRSWDDFEIPLPFARVVIVIGDPVGDPSRLGQRIDAAEQRARTLLLAGGAS